MSRFCWFGLGLGESTKVSGDREGWSGTIIFDDAGSPFFALLLLPLSLSSTFSSAFVVKSTEVGRVALRSRGGGAPLLPIAADDVVREGTTGSVDGLESGRGILEV